MSITNFPNGLSSFGIPVVGTSDVVTTGNVFFVSSTAAGRSDASDHGSDPTTPFATLDFAIGRCTATNGDVIFVMPGHAETISAAAGVACDVAGIRIVGMGEGLTRPTFTFSATASTMTVSAANIKIENIRCVPSIDSVVSAIVVSAAGCTIGTPQRPVEFKDASSTVEFVRAILTTAAADDLVVNAIYKGDTGGNAVVNAVRLVGANNADVTVDFYGVASTAVVEFLTTACTNVKVRGVMYNSGTTDGSKNVIDTQGSSTWYMDVIDAAAGARYTGGSAAAVASDDISSITAALYGSAGVVTFPSGAAAANGVSMAEVLRYIQDQVINGTGTVLDTNTSLYGVLAGATGIPTFPTAAVPANGVSIAEVLRDAWDALRNGTGGTEPGTNKSVIDAIGMTGTARVADAAGQLSSANGTVLFVTSTVVSSSIPNNTQTGGAITGASSGTLILEDILINTGTTGLVAPTNIEFSSDNVAGKTGAGAPIFLEAVAGLGANITASKKDATTHFLPFVLESGKKIFIHGDDAAGTGAGTASITLQFRRGSDGATIAAVNLP